MNNFNPRRKIVDILLITTCILVIATIIYHFTKEKEYEKTHNATKYALKEMVMWDLYYHYENLRGFASQWNSDYAKLSLDANRDTIKHPKYTVKEFSFLHSNLIREITNYENEPFVKSYKIDKAQLVGLFPVNYDSQLLFRTYKRREKLYTYSQELNAIYTTLTLNSNSTDSVKTSWTSENKFHTYFTILREMDKLIFDLLSEEYPQSLQFLFKSEPAFMQSAKERLLNKQVRDLETPSSYKIYTPQALNLKQNMTECLSEITNQIQNMEFEINQGKALLLVAMDSLNGQDANEAKNKIANELYRCYDNINKDYDRELFLYLSSPDGTAKIRMPEQSNLVNFSEQNKADLFKFYEENSSYYIAEGTFAPIYLWYPKAIREAIEEYNKTP